MVGWSGLAPGTWTVGMSVSPVVANNKCGPNGEKRVSKKFGTKNSLSPATTWPLSDGLMARRTKFASDVFGHTRQLLGHLRQVCFLVYSDTKIRCMEA